MSKKKFYVLQSDADTLPAEMKGTYTGDEFPEYKGAETITLTIRLTSTDWIIKPLSPESMSESKNALFVIGFLSYMRGVYAKPVRSEHCTGTEEIRPAMS